MIEPILQGKVLKEDFVEGPAVQQRPLFASRSCERLPVVEELRPDLALLAMVVFEGTNRSHRHSSQEESK